MGGRRATGVRRRRIEIHVEVDVGVDVLGVLGEVWDFTLRFYNIGFRRDDGRGRVEGRDDGGLVLRKGVGRD